MPRRSNKKPVFNRIFEEALHNNRLILQGYNQEFFLIRKPHIGYLRVSLIISSPNEAEVNIWNILEESVKDQDLKMHLIEWRIDPENQDILHLTIDLYSTINIAEAALKIF